MLLLPTSPKHSKPTSSLGETPGTHVSLPYTSKQSGSLPRFGSTSLYFGGRVFVSAHHQMVPTQRGRRSADLRLQMFGTLRKQGAQIAPPHCRALIPNEGRATKLAPSRPMSRDIAGLPAPGEAYQHRVNPNMSIEDVAGAVQPDLIHPIAVRECGPERPTIS